MDTWYMNGTEVVFACGGGIYTSAAEAAAKVGGKVIGVDVDQAAIIDKYGEGMTVTSAMKGLQAATESALDKAFTDKWSELGGKIETLNLQADKGYVGLPTAEASWGFKTFTTADYEAKRDEIAGGTVTVSDDIGQMPAVGSHVTLNVIQ